MKINPAKPTISIAYNFNFDDDSGLSYEYGLKAFEKGESFNTNCLDFFSSDFQKTHEVVVFRLNSSKLALTYISIGELLSNEFKSEYNNQKEIRESHDLHKMLLADAFTWRDI
jgi:hypothetical protein